MSCSSKRSSIWKGLWEPAALQPVGGYRRPRLGVGVSREGQSWAEPLTCRVCAVWVLSARVELNCRTPCWRPENWRTACCVQEKSHTVGVRRVMSKLLRSPQFSHSCRVWTVRLPRVLQGDSDALSYARPHSLCTTGGGGRAEEPGTCKGSCSGTRGSSGAAGRSPSTWQLEGRGDPVLFCEGRAGRLKTKPKLGRCSQRETRTPSSST